jgi:hypothetical protein
MTSAKVSAYMAVILLYTYFVPLVTTIIAGRLTAVSVRFVVYLFGISCDYEQCGLFDCGVCQLVVYLFGYFL